MITPAELKMVTARLVSRDKRTIGEVEATDWMETAEDGRWTYATAMRAVRELLRNPDGPYITPAHVDQVIRKMRSKAAETFRPGHEIPDGRPDLHRAALTAHCDRLLAQWAETGDMPLTAIAAGTEPRALPQARHLAIEGPAGAGSEIAVSAPNRPARGRRMIRPVSEAHKRAQARAAHIRGERAEPRRAFDPQTREQVLADLDRARAAQEEAAA